MSALKQKIEKSFSQLGKVSYEKPWLFIAASLLFLVFFIWQLNYAVIDTSTEGFLKKNDPAILVLNQFKEEFGKDEHFIVAIEAEKVFTKAFLTEFIKMHKEFAETVPYADSVDSLFNAREILSVEGDLIVKDLLEELPIEQSGYDELGIKVLANPLYKNSYISADGKMINIYIRPDVLFADKNKKTGVVTYKPLGEPEIHAMFVGIKSVLEHYPSLNQTVYISGTPAITEELNVYLINDMLKFMVLILLVIGLVLFVLYRQIIAVILPLLVVFAALLSTMGLMCLTGQPIQMPTVILPSFIIAVGVGDAIHLLSMFFTQLRSGVDKKQSICNALEHAGIPIFFTSITTAASLFSFANSSILPIANLGIFAAAGVMFAFAFTLFLMPALLAVTPIKVVVQTEHKKHTLFDRFLEFSITFTKEYAKSIVVVGFIITGLSFYGAIQLRFSHDPVKWLPKTSEGRQAIEVVSEKLGGTVPVEVIINTGKMDGVKDPVFMAKLNDSIKYLEDYKSDTINIGKVLGVPELLKETNQALFDNDPAEYKIPDSQEVIAQEFLMLESSGANDLFKLVDRDYSKARVTVLTPWIDALYFGDFLRDIQSTLDKDFAGIAQVEITGIVPMLAKTLKHIMNSTAVSYALAFVVITFMMMGLLGSVKYGLVSMLPNLLPITLVMALMYVNSAPLDMFTMLIGSIAIGLAVDDTVHFMHGFQRLYGLTNDAEYAVAETLRTSGRAMLSTSIVLALGFIIYVFSSMNNLQNFGFYTALCIVVALLADFWMSPALMLLMNKKKSENFVKDKTENAR